jgi:crossover junction endodeoxyribonuclease RuvC
MPTVLSLDLGTKMGWVFYYEEEDGKFVEFSGVKNFSTKRFEGAGMRYLNFRKWLDSKHHRYSPVRVYPSTDIYFPEGGFPPIEEVYFEEVNHSGWRNSSAVYGGFLATLSCWCEQHKIPYKGIPVTTIKKFITGKGNANKAAVIKAIQARGYDIKDDNQADAMALSLYVRNQNDLMKEEDLHF